MKSSIHPIKGTIKPSYLFDRWLLFSALTLIVIGLLMVASASIVISEKQYGGPFHFLSRQVIFLVIGMLCAVIVLRTPSEKWQQTGMPLLIVSLILLVLVLVPGIGREVNGSRRWIGFGPLGLQISEFTKFVFIVYLAGYLVRYREEVSTRFSGFLKPMGLLAVIAVLLLKEPDFGAVVVIVTTALVMMYMAGVRLWQFAILLAVVGGAFALLAITSPYRLMRLTAFLNPWANQFDSGYQLTQSLIAFGRGGWLGVGLGDSIQKLFYLPEAHTDFLFAVLAEELGLLGAAAVMALYGLFISRILLIARRLQRQNNLFNAYMAYGFGLWLGLQTMINIGVNAGVLPTKGLTLPFMSYGGSSMLINCIVIAMLLRIDYESRFKAILGGEM